RAFVDEMLEGVLLAHPDKLRSPVRRVVVRADAPRQGKVGIVTGGGSGHLPLFMGYVGTGLADGVAIGDVFASPSSQQILDATQAVDGGTGVLYLYGNYSGDVMNFDMAGELALAEGVETSTVLGSDDVASAPAGSEHRRRGVAGIAFLYKVAGALAEEGASLAEVTALALRAAGGLRSMGVALSPCVLPAAGVPTFTLPDGEMEIGMGIHGEPGVRRGALEPAARIAEQLVSQILGDFDYRGSDVAVLVNGLGATPREELYVLFRSVHAALAAGGANVRRTWVGEYATSLEMAGASVSVLKLDDEILRLIDAPCESPFVVKR
ncbi:MAG TPA: dihydroxyacetone kinase subunit DhaK, partial [Acidimicrobiales bacterium]|nr:dihydroxyacetone kinase subunit DhaK [Acidimicrobiales bacterium]